LLRRSHLFVVLAGQGAIMMVLRLELEDVVTKLRDAQDELRLAIAADECGKYDDLRAVIDVLQDVILRIQLST